MVRCLGATSHSTRISLRICSKNLVGAPSLDPGDVKLRKPAVHVAMIAARCRSGYRYAGASNAVCWTPSNASAGVIQPSTRRGRWLSLAATALRWSWVNESPWEMWRLLTSETRMESCRRNSRQARRRRVGTARRRRPPRCPDATPAQQCLNNLWPAVLCSVATCGYAVPGRPALRGSLAPASAVASSGGPSWPLRVAGLSGGCVGPGRRGSRGPGRIGRHDDRSRRPDSTFANPHYKSQPGLSGILAADRMMRRRGPRA